ncbi:MAG: triose-phosphate isomerase [Candidatus Schekmanbacteria bacterium RIFCSPLOWO2_02_FULL_38_14]|uniref:Triosephosphate isomerase n=1 Tax=Candidatus Schekmanbacteria bacterium RIFCSPLOWO2_12_FULL_38_15 TaxID=1817883 RepID=A0A1F7SFI2_9BACT|nr:MAG: triose-phosphate isomerase [Candidatus Schekmanbacteria bacterium RIFCSPLOWO2_02_FULL_38_14]OGL52519.1 MAG: triose-phosphate isomerase [Candidatus Schekmanbacteria bacterium RIFCSPLOWO2_12_FULL_38_15]
MRRTIIAGNWKMNNSVKESVSLAREIAASVDDVKGREIVIAPPFTSLYPVSKEIEGSKVKLSAQNLFWKENGAYTGEISASMLKDAGCEYVIIGHSERRQFFGEIDESVNQKIKTAMKYNLNPIVCAGETLEEREKGKTFEVIRRQVEKEFAGLSASEIKNIVIAYEPVWAIGTGKTATPKQANEVHLFIRNLIKEFFNREISDNLSILYGGSVKPDNIKGLMEQGEIDGALVGGASLKGIDFLKLVKY